MALPAVPIIAKGVAATGAATTAKTAVSTVGRGSFSKAGSAVSRFGSGTKSVLGGITGTTAGAGAGGIAGGYGFAQVQNTVDELGGSMTVVVWAAIALAVVYVLGQLFDIGVGS